MAKYEIVKGARGGRMSHCGRRHKRVNTYASTHGISAHQARERLRGRASATQPDTPADAAALATPLAELKLTTRGAEDALRREGLTSVGAIVARTEAELLRIRGFGPKGLGELKKKLGTLNVTLEHTSTPAAHTAAA